MWGAIVQLSGDCFLFFCSLRIVAFVDRISLDPAESTFENFKLSCNFLPILDASKLRLYFRGGFVRFLSPLLRLSPIEKSFLLLLLLLLSWGLGEPIKNQGIKFCHNFFSILDASKLCLYLRCCGVLFFAI